MIRLEGITKLYANGDVAHLALRGVNLAIERGEFVAIRGSSGSGKSTLLSIIGCLDRPSSGAYWLEDFPVVGLEDSQLAAIRNRKFGFVFQTFNLIARVSALHNVEIPLLYGSDRQRRPEKALAALEAVGLAARSNHYPAQLSGGEQQRVAIARALITEPAVLLADEPTGNLDSTSSAEIMRLLSEIHRQGRTIVVVTHDSEVASHAQRRIRVKDGLAVDEISGQGAR